MSKTRNKFSPEARTRAIRIVLKHEGEYPSRWAAIVSISEKIGCVPQTLHEWVKKPEVERVFAENFGVYGAERSGGR